MEILNFIIISLLGAFVWFWIIIFLIATIRVIKRYQKLSNKNDQVGLREKVFYVKTKGDNEKCRTN